MLTLSPLVVFHSSSASYMSIKIRTAENSMDDSELSILDTLNRNDFPGKWSTHNAVRLL